MINRVVLVGRLTRDPELKYTPNGIAVANFTLAVNRTFTSGNGEKEADFIQCQAWRKTAENVANYLKKGSLAGVDGQLRTRSYENNEGKKVFVTEVMAESVQFLDTKKNNDNSGPSNYNNNNQQNYGSNNQQSYNNNNQRNNQQQFGNDPFADNGQPIIINDDDLPF